MQEKPLSELALVNYLGKYIKDVGKPIRLNSGGSLAPIINSMGGYDFEVSVGGSMVLFTTNGQWGYGLTPAETGKQSKFSQIFGGLMKA